MSSKRAIRRAIERKRAHRQRWQYCGRKIIHPTPEDAMKVIETLRIYKKDRETATSKLHVYACGLCGGFHIGHTERLDD